MVNICNICKGKMDVTGGTGPPTMKCAYYEIELKTAKKECEPYEKRSGGVDNTNAIQWAKEKRNQEELESQKSLIVYDKKLGLVGLVLGFILGLAIKSYLGC